MGTIKCPPSGGEPAHPGLLATASRHMASGRLNSVTSQDRSFPSPASKPLPELCSCPFSLLVLKSGRPDSPGRQPRGQRPRQTLFLPYYSASVASPRLGGICEHKREDASILESLSEKGATGLLAGDSLEVWLSLFSAVGHFCLRPDPGPGQCRVGVGGGVCCPGRGLGQGFLPGSPSLEDLVWAAQSWS